MAPPSNSSSQYELIERGNPDENKTPAWIRSAEKSTPARDHSHIVQASKDSFYDQFRYNVAVLWLKEFLGWLVSAALIIGLIVLLRTHQDQPVPKWPYAITLNAVISLLTALARTAMLIPLVEALSQLKWLWFSKGRPLANFETFDEASRGPWGCLKLLTLGYKAPLSGLGALIIIASLAIDPFAQQVVTYQMRNTPTPGNATVGLAQAYGDYESSVMNSQNSPSLPMKAAIYNGIFGPDVPMRPFCPSGDCSWKTPYSSLAVCHSCEDISTQAQVTMDGPNCTASLPNGMVLRNGQWNTHYNISSMALLNRTDPRPIITNMISLQNEPKAPACGDIANVKATSCTLQFCVKSFNGTYQGDAFKEEQLGSFTNDSSTRIVFADGADDLYLFPPPASNASTLSQNMTFAAAGSSLKALQQHFMVLFNGTASQSAVTGATYFSGSTPLSPMQAGSSAAGLNSLQSDVTQAFFDTKNVTDLMRNLASTMTQGIRTANGIKKTGGEDAAWGAPTELGEAKGIIWIGVPYVNVRWPWVTLLIALDLLTLKFLILTALNSSAGQAPPWKSKALPVLRARLSPSGEMALNSVKQNFQMEHLAHKERVTLRHDAVGTRFVDT